MPKMRTETFWIAVFAKPGGGFRAVCGPPSCMKDAVFVAACSTLGTAIRMVRDWAAYPKKKEVDGLDVLLSSL